VAGQHVAPVSSIRCMHEWDARAPELGSIEFQGGNVIEIVLQHDKRHIVRKGASRNILKRQTRKNLIRTNVLVSGSKMETLGGRMTQPAGRPDTRHKMYLVEGDKFAAPWIHGAMCGRDDEVARDKRACTFHRAAVAGYIDLTDRSPGSTLLVDHFPIVVA
jgi:hypothetical protein